MKQIETNDFNQIVLLIEEAKNRAYQKVNEELVSLYFNVGKIVSFKVTSGTWGDNTVDQLAAFIENKYAGLKGACIE